MLVFNAVFTGLQTGAVAIIFTTCLYQVLHAVYTTKAEESDNNYQSQPGSKKFADEEVPSDSIPTDDDYVRDVLCLQTTDQEKVDDAPTLLPTV